MDISIENARTWNTTENRPFVKICGITNLEDANMCAKMGANAIGILLPRPDRKPSDTSTRICVERAERISKAVLGDIQVFVLVHTNNLDQVDDYVRTISPTALQFCLDELDVETLRQLRDRFPEVSFIRSLKVRPGEGPKGVIEEAKQLLKAGLIDGAILDSEKGGSGKTHDWNVSREVVKNLTELPILLAGGIDSLNAQEALKEVGCIGIDAMNSIKLGTDSKRKDSEKVKALIHAVRS